MTARRILPPSFDTWCVYGWTTFEVGADEYAIGHGGPQAYLDSDGKAHDEFILREFMHPERFSDKVYLFKRVYGFGLPDAGLWTFVARIIDRSTFPHMQDAAYLNRNPQTYVSAVTVGQVRVVGNMIDMTASVCVNDASVGTEPNALPSPYGSRINPWANFVAMEFSAWAGDVTKWRVECSPGLPDTAVVLRHEPSADDRNPDKIFHKGINQIHEGPDGYFVYTFWGREGIAYGLGQFVSGGARLWSREGWINAPGGVIHERFNWPDHWYGAAFDRAPRGIVLNPDQTIYGPKRYVIPLLDDGIAWTTTDDLSLGPSGFTPRQNMVMPAPFDNVRNAIIDPWLAPDGTWYFASPLGGNGKMLRDGSDFKDTFYTAGLGPWEITAEQPAVKERRRPS